MAHKIRTLNTSFLRHTAVINGGEIISSVKSLGCSSQIKQAAQIGCAVVIFRFLIAYDAMHIFGKHLQFAKELPNLVRAGALTLKFLHALEDGKIQLKV